MIRRIAVALIVLAGLIFAAAIALPLPEVSSFEGFAAFELLAWLDPISGLGALAVVIITTVRRLARRRGSGWLAIFLPILICTMTTILYLPLGAAIYRRVDRVAGRLYEPIPEGRAIALSIFATLTLAIAFIAITRVRNTPASTRQAAAAVPMIICTILVFVYVLFVVMPVSNEWFPAQPNLDRHVPFRPCRGALLWENASTYPSPVGRVEDIWLRFADPRKGGEPIWAISVNDDWSYTWLDRAEASTFKVRNDDPSVLHCDSRARREVVAPAAWHQCGARFQCGVPLSSASNRSSTSGLPK